MTALMDIWHRDMATRFLAACASKSTHTGAEALHHTQESVLIPQVRNLALRKRYALLGVCGLLQALLRRLSSLWEK